MESAASAGIAMEQMVEDFGEPRIMYDGHVAVRCVWCHAAMFDWAGNLDHVQGKKHRRNSLVIRRRQELRRLRRAAREAMQ